MDDDARCRAILRLDAAEGRVSFRCQLRDGHGGSHSDEGLNAGSPYVLMWKDPKTVPADASRSG